MILRVLLFAGISLNFAFVGKAEEYNGLIVEGDYRKLNVLCQVYENQWGITKTDFERAIKLRFLGNRLKMLPLPDDSSLWMHYLKVNFECVGDVFILELKLKKMSKVYAKSTFSLGAIVEPMQGTYGSFGKTPDKSDIMEKLNGCLDRFLLDYLESNISYLEDVETLREYQKELNEGEKALEKSSK